MIDWSRIDTVLLDMDVHAHRPALRQPPVERGRAGPLRRTGGCCPGAGRRDSLPRHAGVQGHSRLLRPRLLGPRDGARHRRDPRGVGAAHPLPGGMAAGRLSPRCGDRDARWCWPQMRTRRALPSSTRPSACSTLWIALSPPTTSAWCPRKMSPIGNDSHPTWAMHATTRRGRYWSTTTSWHSRAADHAGIGHLLCVAQPATRGGQRRTDLPYPSFTRFAEIMP